ncbi:50S ribosomal protein L29 [Candidatus Peregrinibacteria bacterium CG10_big_fil_rev_8_21_14_0_10_36_19]|nr:MAG: 50S ribosomal protein L29 [Candidatus Peregrinibacteria bacterium CG10_big_fil_rev_8_21_14_0_10_36_19]
MTLEELKQLDKSKLNAELIKAQESLFKIKFEVKSGQSKSSHEIDRHKAQVARIKTLINQKND